MHLSLPVLAGGPVLVGPVLAALMTLALPALGAVHGKLPVARFLDLLRAALERSRPTCLESLVLLAPKGVAQDLERLLDV